MQSRTSKAFRNITISLICQLITIVLGFLCRKSLIVFLGLPYVGANSLFTNIINLLSFVELGIGNAIVFSLYKPIVDGDTKTISAYIHFFKKLYNLIAVIVLLLGISLMPFLRFIVTADEGIKENIYLMYGLTVLATSCTYLFAAPKTLLIADQKQFVEKIIYQVTHITQIVFQIVILFWLKNYYLFLVMQIVFALFNNVFASLVTFRKYPYIRHKEILSNDLVKKIFSDVGATFFYKVGSSLLNYIDAILISYFCGLTYLGILSNYLLVLTTLSGLLIQVTSTVSATVGNKNASSNIDECRKTFYPLLFLTNWIASFFFVSFMFLSTPFVSILYGEDCVLTDRVILFSMSFLFLVQDVHSLSSTYRFSMGLFRKGRFAPLIASGLNLVLSIFFYYLFGVAGLYIATIFARIVTLGIVDSYLITGSFKGSLDYFLKELTYLVGTAIVYTGVFFLSKVFVVDGWLKWVLFGIIITVIFNVFWPLLFFWKKEEKQLFSYIKLLFLKSYRRKNI